MPQTPYFDLDIDTTLGGSSASDYVVPSQKAIKDYVDNHGGNPAWGNITGTLSNQTDLQDALNGKQDALTAGTDLEIVQGSILPNSYTQLTSIASTGTQWINTGVKLTNNFKSIIVGRLTETPSTNFRTILGANNNNLSTGKQNVLLGWGNSANGFYAEPCLNPSYTYSSYPWDTNTHTFTTNVTPTVTTFNIDGVVDTINSAPSITGVNLAIFARLAQNDTVGSQVNFELNSIELYQSNVLVFNGVPAKRNSDDEVGLYDTVSGSFFSNSGTGDFIAGSEVPASTVINFANDTGYITGITSSDVVNALGYTPATLPSQTGQSGKYLTTDGTSTSWGTVTASVASDNKSITKNSSNELQTVGVIDQNNTSSAIKTWTGTRAQYEAIVTKDATTLYTITDDTDATLSVIEALYPVGSIYITTANSCPLANIISGSTWVLVSAGMVLQGADGNHAAGTIISAGLPNITGSVLFDSNSSNQFIPTDAFNGCLYGTNTATKSNYLSTATTGGSNKERARQLNVDASRSNPIYGGSNTVQPPAFAVNIYRRTA